MIKAYKLRIDTADQTAVATFISKYATQYLYCFEKTGTLDCHIHAYLESHKTDASMRAHIRKYFGTGNKVYSLTVCDEFLPLEYCAYITKDGDYQGNLGEPFMEACLAYDHTVKQKLKKKPKRVFSDISEAYSEYLKTNPITFQEPDHHAVTFLVDYYISQDKMISKHQIQGYAISLLCKYHHYRGKLIHDIVCSLP